VVEAAAPVVDGTVQAAAPVVGKAIRATSRAGAEALWLALRAASATFPRHLSPLPQRQVLRQELVRAVARLDSFLVQERRSER